jgi:hypothetical protein
MKVCDNAFLVWIYIWMEVCDNAFFFVWIHIWVYYTYLDEKFVKIPICLCGICPILANGVSMYAPYE